LVRILLPRLSSRTCKALVSSNRSFTEPCNGPVLGPFRSVGVSFYPSAIPLDPLGGALYPLVVPVDPLGVSLDPLVVSSSLLFSLACLAVSLACLVVSLVFLDPLVVFWDALVFEVSFLEPQPVQQPLQERHVAGSSRYRNRRSA
jgi:hypothetical protein